MAATFGVVAILGLVAVVAALALRGSNSWRAFVPFARPSVVGTWESYDGSQVLILAASGSADWGFTHLDAPTAIRAQEGGDPFGRAIGEVREREVDPHSLTRGSFVVAADGTATLTMPPSLLGVATFNGARCRVADDGDLRVEWAFVSRWRRR